MISLVECMLPSNTSKTYYDGSVWSTNRSGDCTIVGRSSKTYKHPNGWCEHKSYVIEFTDGTRITAPYNAIKSGNVNTHKGWVFCVEHHK